MSKDWTYDCSKYIREELSNISLLPRPHLSILGTRFEDQFGITSDKLEDAEDEVREINKKVREEPTLAEVEEKSQFIPNMCKYELIVRPESSPASILISTKFAFRVSNSEILPDDKKPIDPDPKRNFQYVNIVLEVPISYPYPSKIKLRINDVEKEVETLTVSDNLVIKTVWQSQSNPFETRKKDKVETRNHNYKLLIKIILKKLKEKDFLIQAEFLNDSGQSTSASIFDPKINRPRNAYNYGYFLDFSIINECKNSLVINVPNTKNITLFSENGDFDFPMRKCEFRDHSFIKENIPKMIKVTNSGKEEIPSETFAKMKYPIDKLVGYSLENGPRKFPSLYQFQKDAIEKIMTNLIEGNQRISCIVARTAGGKTEAFMIPIIDYCLKNISKKGTKAILIYPTKALANDQLNRTISLLSEINEKLKSDKKRKITVGIYHGDIIPDEDKDQITKYAIFRCPYCSQVLKISETIQCENEKCLYLQNKGTKFIADNVMTSRNEMHANPPDILITNPDMLNMLMLSKPASHTIFGRSTNLLRCKECGEIIVSSHKRQKHSAYLGYYAKYSDRKCDGKVEKYELQVAAPKFIVIDEIHLMYGSFGIHLSYIITRLNNLMRTYDESAKVMYIASSATIRNPDKYLSTMFSVDKGNIDIFPEPGKDDKYYDFKETDETVRRYHLFMMPNAYKTALTLSFAYYKLLEYFNNKEMGIPNVLTFVNAIAASNALIQTTRHRVAREFEVKIDGHSTEFDSTERARKEDEFNKNKLNFLFATKTLEVGVDFDKINVLGLFGSPYSFNDFLQRIGRAGRKNSALVLTFFRTFNPVDNFYYSRCWEFLDYKKDVRDFYMEELPISRNNIIIAKKSIQSIFFDYLQSRPDAYEYIFVDGRPFFELIYDFRLGKINPEFVEFVRKAVSPSALDDKELLQYLEEMILIFHELLSSPIFPMRKLMRTIFDRRGLTSLRTSDKQLDIYIPSVKIGSEKNG